jgi:catechol 2,3-dioxygenase-like lactoylglutathione lyase family enzyme
MVSRFTELVVDCRDPWRLAAFWRAVLGFEVIDERPDVVEIGSWEPDPASVRERQGPPTIVFVRMPEGETGKNRLHLDISPADRTHQEEVDRLVALGARPVAVGAEQGAVRQVLADPEGNEFCVLRSLAAPA